LTPFLGEMVLRHFLSYGHNKVHFHIDSYVFLLADSLRSYKPRVWSVPSSKVQDYLQ